MAHVISRMNWYWQLSDSLLEKNQKSSAGLRGELEKNIISLYKNLLSYLIRSVCSCYRKRAAVLFRNVVKLDDWAGALQSIKDAEKVVQQDIGTYNTREMIDSLGDIAEQSKSHCTYLQNIHQAIHQNTSKQEQWRQDDKNQQCLRHLLVTDPSKDKVRIQQTKGGLLRDSYCWILDHTGFQQWCNKPDNHLLWIKGDPGKGKTMLLCGIIDEFEKIAGTSHLLVYFFCQATNNELNKATNVLRGLIYFLIREQPSLVSHIRKEYDSAGEKMFEGNNVWFTLSKILADILQDPSLPDTTLVIDALDECVEGLILLLDLILQLPVSPKVKWIVSSRNWPTIEGRLDTAPQKVRLCLELNESSISDAVRIYIRHKVEQLAELKKLKENLRNDVQEYLYSNAHDTFLWVALVCQALEDPEVPSWHTRNTLKAFPPGLDNLYEQMMKRITNSTDVHYYQSILAATLVVNRPLTLQELTCLVESLETNFADDFEQIEDLIKRCGSFLTLQGKTVFFVHQSAKDYLLQKAADKIFPSGASAEHSSICSRSLKVMSRELRRNIYNLRDWGVPTDQIKTPDPDPLAAVRYSCIHWGDHLLEEQLQSGQFQVSWIDDFLREHYLHWLEALSILGNVSEGILAMLKLNKLIQVRVYYESYIAYC